MSTKGERLFRWLSTVLFLLGLYLTGVFGAWIGFIPPNPAIGWSICFAVVTADLLRAWLKPPQVDPSKRRQEVERWERTRVKGKLYYAVVYRPMLAISGGAVVIILLQATNQLGQYENLNLYTFACDVAILASIYGVRIRDWQMREEQYKSSLRATDAV